MIWHSFFQTWRFQSWKNKSHGLSFNQSGVHFKKYTPKDHWSLQWKGLNLYYAWFGALKTIPKPSPKIGAKTRAFASGWWPSRWPSLEKVWEVAPSSKKIARKRVPWMMWIGWVEDGWMTLWDDDDKIPLGVLFFSTLINKRNTEIFGAWGDVIFQKEILVGFKQTLFVWRDVKNQLKRLKGTIFFFFCNSQIRLVFFVFFVIIATFWGECDYRIIHFFFQLKNPFLTSKLVSAVGSWVVTSG